MFQILSSTPKVFVASGTFLPSDISGIEGWYDANALTGFSDDDPVGGSGSEWTDQTSNGYDLTQGTATRQPLYKTNIQNGKPGILFDGVNDWINTTSINLTQPTSIFIVCNPDTGSDNIFDSNTNGARNTLVESGGNYLMFAGSGAGTGTSYSTSAQVLMCVFDGSSSVFYFNNDSAVTSLNPGSQGMTGFKLGANETGFGNFFKGYIFEAIVYDSALTSDNWSDLKSYADTEWGLGL